MSMREPGKKRKDQEAFGRDLKKVWLDSASRHPQGEEVQLKGAGG